MLRSDSFEQPEFEPRRDDTSSIIYLKRLESLLIILVPVKQ